MPIISTHTLTWSVTSYRRNQRLSQADFNSHAHVERDDALPDIISAIIISTHTLTWSVTSNLLCPKYQYFISTHTLTWSVTGVQNYHRTTIRISTHTLTWSVTHTTAPRIVGKNISTHTLTWSVTSRSIVAEFFGEVFQLTRSRGA